jgi:Cys-tRNA(Pro)/Cys-tRNA(Cys) deacylase
MVLIDGKAACALVPSDRQMNMKQLATLAEGKRATMMPPAEAEKFTAYKVGGISPLGWKRPAPVFVDKSAYDFESIYINGGQRGLQILIAPDKLVAATSARVDSFTS